MARGVTCDHLNKLSDVLGKELWQNKETLKCFDCGCPGPNLWICLQPECHHIGCSEMNNDHSTRHQKKLPTHCVHMNVSTERIWCYACEREVYATGAATHAAKLKHTQQSPDSTSLAGSPAARLGLDRGGFNISLGDDDDDDGEPDEEGDFGDGDNEGKPSGLVGLQNMGNTCYMNAALQALSNTPPLTQHFLDCAAAVQVLAADKKPGLSRSYQKLVNEIWNKKTRGSVVPNGILYGIRNVHPMFRGYHQHDTQEFLRCFMDQLHEELKERVGGTEETQHPGGVTRQPTVAADGNGNDSLSLYGDGQRGRRRARRRSPAPSTLSESRGEGYYRVHTQSESGGSGSPHSAVQVGSVDARLVRHRRSASFGGSGIAASTAYAALARDSVLADEVSKQTCPSDSDGSAEERYETCSSGANSDAADAPLTHACKRKKESPPCSSNPRGTETGDTRTSTTSSCSQGATPRYRSVISDVFDGKLLSSVQCLTCDRISTRMETFQDLSLPIPSREHIAVLRGSQQLGNTAVTCSDAVYSAASQDGWLWWLLSWLRSWFYGPVVSLQDCLAAFFSADELKGDNMYSCERCNKLRNGVKYSRVVRLPEVLCVHLKRFRHELMFSAKVAARVSFPLRDLDMRPYLHKDCTSTVSSYSLSAVICHAGTAGGGHYTCVARNARARAWYEFDDQCVTPLAPDQVAAAEAYVLFYKKTNPQMAALRQKAAELLESSANNELDDMKFYISKQWINKFKTWAEPGAIDNSDFVCAHGGVRPDRAPHVHQLAAVVSQPLWEFLHANFGGGPACNHVHECGACRRAAELLKQRQMRELLAFLDLHAKFQEQECPTSVYAISMNWFRQWQAFVREKSHEPPPPVDNEGILTKINVAQDSTNLAAGTTQTYILKPGSDHAQLSEELWRFFIDIYGGGPEVKLKSVTAYERTNDYPTSYVTNQHSQSCSNVASNNQDSYYSLPHNSTQRSTEFTNQRRLVKKKSESDHDEPLHNHNQYSSPKPGLYADIYNGDVVRNTQSLQNIESAKSKSVVMNNSGQSSDESARPQRMSCDSDDEVASSRKNRTSIRYVKRHFRHRQSASADSDDELQTNTDSISYASDTKVYNNKAKDYNNSVNCITMENGFNDNSSSAEHDTNENSVGGKCAGAVGCLETDVTIELPNLENISLKAKSSSAVNSRQNAAKSRRRRANNAQGAKPVHSPTNGCPPRDGGDRRLVK